MTLVKPINSRRTAMSATPTNTITANSEPAEPGRLRQDLVAHLKNAGFITTPQVEAAFRAVPRHLFLPALPVTDVYQDTHFFTKQIDGIGVSSSSRPAIMAIMLEQLGLAPGHRVLEIGAGTGYNAALLAHLVGETGRVVTVDLDDDTAAQARPHLIAAGCEQVEVICGDGALGYAAGAPYDRIILTVGAWDILPAWREQLRGRLVLPLTIRPKLMVSAAFEVADTHLYSVSAHFCDFMPLRGIFAHPAEDCILALGPMPGLVLDLDRDPQHAVDAERLYTQLCGSYRDIATHQWLTPDENTALNLWLRLHEVGWCALSATGELAQPAVVPPLFGQVGEYCFTTGLCSQTGLCLCTRAPDQAEYVPFSVDAAPFELYLRQFGSDDGLAQRMLNQVLSWNRIGRPSGQQLPIRAYPKGARYTTARDQAVIQKVWNDYVVF
jgi:protein-L-isoaspartate(D-aspartate) O-methyltransferase